MIKYEHREDSSVSDIQRLTITLPDEMAVLVKLAVDDGDYASTSEVVREALRDWKLKRELRAHKLRALKAEVDRGLADITEGRTREFNPERIIQRGRKLSVERRRSA
jgi:antitoxin ParD1/3/4